MILYETNSVLKKHCFEKQKTKSNFHFYLHSSNNTCTSLEYVNSYI